MLPHERAKRDMAEARVRTTIDVEQVRNLLFGGQSKWDTHARLLRVVSQDPVFDKSERPFLARKDRYKRAISMTNRIYELRDIHGWSIAETAEALDLIDEELPIHLSSATFDPVFMDQCGPYLREKYGELVVNRGIQGTYLQTELAHGSDVASLETTATYIPEAKEFEVHSPTLTSTKWWAGAAGRTATHGVVQAQLILPGGKSMGPHLFLVQLRSLDDHRLLPGIVMGDIGPKALGGYTTVDNGFARFDHVRISHENMLSAFSQVTEDGRYVKPPHAKLSYGGMMVVRSLLVGKGAWVMAKAATVSIRYCTVRRQGGRSTDGLERQVITYPGVYYRLLPVLSHAYIFIILGQSLLEQMAVMNKQLATGDASMVSEMHLTSCALKILATTMGAQDAETTRRAMGGHGYSEFAAVGRYYANFLPTTTYEGDNFVLDLQIVRGALKAYKSLQSSSFSVNAVAQLPPSSAYLRFLLPQFTTKLSEPDWTDPTQVVVLLERRASAMVGYRAETTDIDASMDNRVSKATIDAYLSVRVRELIESLPQILQPREASVVSKLYTLTLLTLVESGLVDILSFDLLPQNPGDDPCRGLRATINALCTELLPEVIGLTDAFGFTDWELDSALGVHDGSVYEQLWARAQKEPLNAEEPVDGYEQFVKPMLRRGQLLSGTRGERSKL
ncbi:acyl-CoA oxidase [Rhodofomes roseus]|uniref:Acyl-coenzyme A oxidase n=1 Tax=Rhodofomes roseus TaxID=34475 RepID=A0ABQ8KBH2_9APHY|nr:acyl-CoA oxidase [Rhodofomes roseus]KAH9834504.1 acyl-CoA oxidase [Rhodofomes roseus]